MGNYENIVKTEEIRKKVEEGDLLSAQNILDTMDLKKVKNISDLNLFAEVFMENEKYDESAELYLKIYDKYKTRKATAQMVNISIKRGNLNEAEDYLNEYRKIAPDDFDSYIFRYKLDKIKGASYEQLIRSLEAVKKIDYTEKWSYELAKTYYKADMEKECIRECSDIILWFGEGRYVEKAKLLRSYFTGETNKANIMDEIKRRSEDLREETKSHNLEENVNYEVREESEGNKDFEENKNSEQNKYSEENKNRVENKNLKEIKNPEEKENSVEEENLEKEEKPEGRETFADIYTGEDTFDEEVLNNTSEDKPDQLEEAICSGSDFMAENGMDELADGLMRDVQDILSIDGQNEKQSEYDLEEAELTAETQKQQEKEDEASERCDDISQDNNESDLILSNIGKELQFDPTQIFGDFLQIISVKRQLVKSLEIIMQDNTNSVFMAITGKEDYDKTIFAKAMALFLYKAGKIQSSKIAKISADKLNKIDINSKKAVLKSCCLMIEKADELKNSTINQILELAESVQGDIAVIFETDKENMMKLCDKCPERMNLIKLQIDQSMD